MKSLVPIIFLFVSMLSTASSWLQHHSLTKPKGSPPSIFHRVTQSGVESLIVADLYINLSDFFSNSKPKFIGENEVFIIADTVDIPDDFSLNIENKNLYILAREVVGSGLASVNLIGQNRSSGSFSVVSNDIKADIHVVSLYENFDFDYDVLSSKEDSLGTLVSLSGEKRIIVDIDPSLFGGFYPINQSYFQDFFGNVFDMAISTYDQKPDLSIAMLTWVEKLLSAVPEITSHTQVLSDLYLQSANAKQFIQHSIASVNYIPKLSSSLYKEIYSQYLDTMGAYQTQYEKYIDKQSDTEDKILTSKLMLGHQSDIISAEEAISDKTEINIKNMFHELENIEKTLEKQRHLSRVSRSNFVKGISEYIEKKGNEQILKVFTAVVDIASSGSKSEAMITAAKTIPQTTQDFIAFRKSIEKISSISGKVSSSVGEMQRLKEKIITDFSLENSIEYFSNMSFNIPSLHSTKDAWDAFLIDSTSNINKAISMNISGSREFLAELEKLVLYSKSISLLQVSIAQEISRYVESKIRTNVQAQQLERITLLIDALKTDNSAAKKLERVYFRDLNRIKRTLYIAISNYRAAFYYWSLMDTTVVPSLNKSYLEYRNDLDLLNTEYQQAFENFDPEPQDFKIRISLNEKQYIDKLKMNGEFSVNFPLTQMDLLSFGRVRLRAVRVYLEGDRLPENSSYYFNIQSNGEYKDRLDGLTFDFNASPVNRLFAYEVRSAGIDIITDGSIANNFSFAYFEPTPFTTWSISIKDFDKLDLSSLEGISIEFEGSGIYQPI